MEVTARGARASVDPLVLASLRRELVDALGPTVGVACSGVDGDPASLFPQEQDAVRSAIVRRQREFASGRAAARAAMAELGWPAMAVPVGPDRSPVWPVGLVGSIAHSAQVCVAITGRIEQVHAMGIDIEEDVALDPSLWSSICTPEELACVEALPAPDRGQRVTRLFCAKEAFYKWQYPQTGRMLDFRDVHVVMRAGQSDFAVRPAVPGNPLVIDCDLEGRLLISWGWVLACLVGAPLRPAGGA